MVVHTVNDLHEYEKRCLGGVPDLRFPHLNWTKFIPDQCHSLLFEMSIESFATSIYHIYHPTTRKLILLACGGIAILTPFTDTVYLPALASVADDFDTNTTMVSLTVSIYLATVGIGQLIWGPLSDYYGRNIVLYLTLVVFEAFTIGCIFVTSIEQLIGLRAVEGLVVGSTLISAQAIITDVFAPDERGTAMSAFLVSIIIA